MVRIMDSKGIGRRDTTVPAKAHSITSFKERSVSSVQPAGKSPWPVALASAPSHCPKLDSAY